MPASRGRRRAPRRRGRVAPTPARAAAGPPEARPGPAASRTREPVRAEKTPALTGERSPSIGKRRAAARRPSVSRSGDPERRGGPTRSLSSPHRRRVPSRPGYGASIDDALAPMTFRVASRRVASRRAADSCWHHREHAVLVTTPRKLCRWRRWWWCDAPTCAP